MHAHLHATIMQILVEAAAVVADPDVHRKFTSHLIECACENLVQCVVSLGAASFHFDY